MTAIHHPQVEFIRECFTTRTVLFHPSWRHVLGSVNAVLFLSQLLYWSGSKSARDRKGWVWKTVRQMEYETSLTGRQQQNARSRLVALGVIEARLKGIPRCWWYRVNFPRLEEVTRRSWHGWRIRFVEFQEEQFQEEQNVDFT